MASLNKILLIGRLTREPELRYTPQGVAVATFTVAVDRPFKNQDGSVDTDFIKVVVWRKLAENVSKYLTKGSLVYVEGRLQLRSYEDSSGIKRKVSEVIAYTVQFLDKKGKEPLDTPEIVQDESFEEPIGDFSADDIPF